jgi:hypothetical protein
MKPQRFLCSQLIGLRNNSVESFVNLEEIWENGAVLESEQPVQEGSKVEMRCGAAFFAGRIVQVERHEVGWRFEVEFSPMTPWNREKFQPEHLLDVSQLGKKPD